MRAVGNDRNQLGFDGGIDLDLNVTVVGIPIDIPNRLLGRIDAHLSWPGELASAVDDASLQHARTELTAIVEARNALQEIIRGIGHVARTGYTVGEIERALDIAEMLMVVP